MADFHDASAGFEIYRSRNGQVSRTALNAALEARRFRKIADRTFGDEGVRRFDDVIGREAGDAVTQLVDR